MADFFDNAPFRLLAGAGFSGQKNRAKEGIRAEHCLPEKEPHADRDAELFFQVVKRMGGRKPGKTSGFLLGEQCALDKKIISGSTRLLSEKRSLPARWEGAVLNDKQNIHSLPSVAPAERDAEIFFRSVGRVQPLAGKGRDVTPVPEQRPSPREGALSLQELLDGKLEFALSCSDEYFEGHVVGLDPMVMNKLRAGALSPEAHLDLHGLTVAQAFEALRDFMRHAWHKGLRTVLIVPGRGRNSPDGMGILRTKLQMWLTQEPCKRVVLAFCTARPHDGGLGSAYVLLRRHRKKGRIFWERRPADADLA